MNLSINGTSMTVPDDQSNEMLVWVLRDTLGLVGTRYGCGIGMCGSCNLLMDGKVVRSCQIRASEAVGKRIVTLEGLATNVYGIVQLHPVQQAFLENPLQCCWCMTGHMIEAVALLERTPNPTQTQIDETMNQNYCRCGGYNNIRRNVVRAAEITREQATPGVRVRLARVRNTGGES
jgi:aerobic-type carbon monoxide dehydrogenase small subunit (CoxS/CutS family)